MQQVHVPQEDGVITIASTSGTTSYDVEDHLIEVAPDDLARLLAVVDGSEVVAGSPVDEDKE